MNSWRSAPWKSFLDLQIKDAKDEVSSVEKALIQAGIPKEIVMAGGKGNCEGHHAGYEAAPVHADRRQ